ncbi:DoxX family protein [Pedobacter sp. PAMC26386]|nr:DoxX family protein [Pedobacter sp. PAMC26386]
MTIKQKNITYWILRLTAAFILLQTLFFKFTGAEESVYIFSTLGMEPWGRIGTGIVELIAAILILIPRTTAIGAVIGMGMMSGALLSHLTVLGIVVKNDSGALFIYALITFICCFLLAYAFRTQLIQLLKKVNIKI